MHAWATGGVAIASRLAIGRRIGRIAAATARIAAALAKGLRTADIKSEGSKVVSTKEMGEAIVTEMKRLT